MQARHTQVKIIYEGHDITRDLEPYLLSFTFNDNSGDKADDIAIQIQDRDGKFLSDWAVSKSDKITCSIVKQEDSSESLPCGMFEVDQIEYSFPPHVLSIKGVSTAITKGMRNENHTRAWENVQIRTICADIANIHGLKLFYDAPDYMIERREQVSKPDIEFLSALCSDYGLSVKVRDNKLIVYDIEEYESHESVSEILLSDKKILSCKFTSKSVEVYRKAKVKYHHPVKHEDYDEEYEDESEEGSERELEIREYAESSSQAAKIAEKRIKTGNKKEITGNISMMGDLRFSGGQNITLGEAGMFSGKYTITKATHKIDSSGYTTSLELGEVKASKSQIKAHKAKRTGKNKKASTSEIFYEGTKYYGYKPE